MATLAWGLLAPTIERKRADNPPVAVKPTLPCRPRGISIQRRSKRTAQLYAFGPDIQVTVSAPKETGVRGYWKRVCPENAEAPRMPSST